MPSEQSGATPPAQLVAMQRSPVVHSSPSSHDTEFTVYSQPLGLTQVKTNPLPRSIQVGDWFFGTYYSETIRRHDLDGQFVGNAGGDSFLGMDIGPDTNHL